MQQNVQQIHNGAGKTNGVVPGNFAIVGDATLNWVAGADDPKANFAEFKGELDPVLQFFAAGIKGVNGQTSRANSTSADILNPSKGGNACQGKSPLDCALDAKPAIVFIDVGRADVATNVPLDQFRNNLTNAVNAATGRGTIPVLVTITGAAKQDETAKLAQYNNVIYEVAQTANIPLFNLYAIRKDNPALIAANGDLSRPKTQATDLTPEGLKFGANVATLNLLRLLGSLKAAVPLG